MKFANELQAALGVKDRQEKDITMKTEDKQKKVLL